MDINVDTSKPTIMHVTESFGGGVIQSIAKLCGFAADEYNLIVVYSVRPQTPEKFDHFYPEGTIFVKWNAVRSISPAADVKSALSLRKIVKQYKPDIMHLHSSKAGAVGRLAFPFGRQNMTILYTPRAYGFLQLDLSKKKRFIYHTLEKILGYFPHITVACGAGEYALAQQIARRSAVINNSISIDYVNQLAGECTKNKRFTVCSSGRISYQKNFPLFVEIARAFEGKPVDFIWIGGDAPEDIDLPENLHVTGWTDYPDSIAMMARADIYVLTSRWEGLSLTVLEAMALGLPCVLSDAVGNKEMVEQGVDGYVATSVKAYVDYISDLYADDHLRERMGDTAKQKMERDYSNGASQAKWLAYYKELI